jgi:uncharacterized protein involved in response to NO
MKLFSPSHPVWLAGFRPFFSLAIVFAIVLPTTWALVFSGAISLSSNINPIQWHAHEMIFGFGGAVLIGFLLTASKNWVNIRGIHGLPLMGLVSLWIVERLFFYLSPVDNFIIKHLILSLFISASAIYIITTLFLNRKKDSFKDNYFFYLLLIFIILAKNFLISESYYDYGITMSIGLFRLAFAVMFERTITQFMKNTEGLSLVRIPWLDLSIKILILLSIFQSFLPDKLAILFLSLSGLLLFVRWLLWRPDIGFKKFSNATMYMGYLGLILHFILEAFKLSGQQWGIGSLSLHTFTFLCMGIIIPSMLIRISQGHTGRKPIFLNLDMLAIFLIFLSAFFRLLIPFLYPEHYVSLILFAGILWSLAFSLLAYRLIPFLLQARIDGKVH